MTRSALNAIVLARLCAQRRGLAYLCIAALLAGCTGPHGPILESVLYLPIPIAVALLQARGTAAPLDLCELSAPLFGRELARAKALAACAGTFALTLMYFAPQLVRDPGFVQLAAQALLPTGITCTLVALSATLRTGWSRALYLALSLAAGLVACALFLAAPAVGALCFCALVSLFGLRQYGEALARYDYVTG